MNRITQLVPDFMRAQPKLAAFALIATFSSGFGQTFFVAVFGGELRAAFDLSHTGYGALYAGATVIAALLLLQAGTLIDRWPLRRITAAAIVLLALGCIVMGLAFHALALGLGFVLIRLGGQGLLGQLGLTAAGRYFHAHRGKAVAVAALGIPIGEASLPAAAVTVMARVDWHFAWLTAAGLLLLILLPLLRWLSRDAPMPQHVSVATDDNSDIVHYSRRQALRDPGFYCLLPALLMVPFIVTGILFHQSAIAEARGWSLTLIASALTGFASGHLLALLLTGPLIDRIGAQRFLPLSLLPLITGLLLLAYYSGAWVAFAQLGLTGVSLGLVSIAGGALWPERYGVRHLGAIRSLAQTAMIFATAAAPILLGVMLDRGVSIAALAVALALATALAALLALLAPARPALTDRH
ncbi:MFS family permease [Methylohalomonas lacus]|uniref:MFS family permease n=2 Tax=Methylohalomonas lacus TaxID=398773 RepID=A0AAE3L4M0_9GAMM|nr:MFS family permease [Methylohalomonas lacus]